MKKFLSTLLAAAMCISLAACGGNNSTPSTSGGGSASSGGSGSAGGSGSGYTGGSYSISLGHICSENHSLHLASLKFKDFVEEQSGGGPSPWTSTPTACWAATRPCWSPWPWVP